MATNVLAKIISTLNNSEQTAGIPIWIITLFLIVILIYFLNKKKNKK